MEKFWFSQALMPLRVRVCTDDKALTSVTPLIPPRERVHTLTLVYMIGVRDVSALSSVHTLTLDAMI